MRRTLFAIGVIALLFIGLRLATAKDLPVVLNDEERNAFEKLCEMAKYANRMGAEQLCAYFANKFAAAERAEELKNAPPKEAR